MVPLKQLCWLWLLWLFKIVFAISIEDICIGQGDHTTFPDPNSCDGFYQCLGEFPIYGKCFNGTVYDPIKKMCNLPENVDCEITTPSKSLEKI